MIIAQDFDLLSKFFFLIDIYIDSVTISAQPLYVYIYMGYTLTVISLAL